MFSEPSPGINRGSNKSIIQQVTKVQLCFKHLKYFTTPQEKIDHESLILSPLFVTQEPLDKSHKIENLTKEEIKVKVFDLISPFNNEKQGLHEEYFQQNTKLKNKEGLALFYYELHKLLEESYENDETIFD